MQIQPSQIRRGDLIRVTETYRDGFRVTEGTVAAVGAENVVFMGGVPAASLTTTAVRTVVVERFGSAAPSRLGAVIRAKVGGIGPITLVRADNTDAPWRDPQNSGWYADSDLSDVQVLSEGAE